MLQVQAVGTQMVYQPQGLPHPGHTVRLPQVLGQRPPHRRPSHHSSRHRRQPTRGDPHLPLPGWHIKRRGRLRQRHCRPLLCRLGKFRKLLPLLTSRHISPKSRGQVYSSCVRWAMLHGSETWGPNASELQRLRRNDHSMVRWICGVSAHDDIPSDQLLEKLGLADITTIIRCGRLRWAGHVERAPSNTGIGMVGNLAVPGKRGRGRPRKTWAECVKTNIRDCGLSAVDPQDRVAW